MNQGGGPDHQIEGGMHSARLGGLGLETGIALGKHIEAILEYSLPGGSERGLLRVVHAVKHLRCSTGIRNVPATGASPIPKGAS